MSDLFRRSVLLASAAALSALPAGAQAAPQSFQAGELRIEALVGRLVVVVDPAATAMTVALSGEAAMIERVRLSTSGDDLIVKMEGAGDDWSMWDWSSMDADALTVTVTLKPGSPVSVRNYVGDAVIGDIQAELDFNSTSGEAKIGAVSEADVSISGSGDVEVASVAGRLEASIAGSGDVKVGPSREAEIEIAGGGDVAIGAVGGDLSIDVAGSGGVKAASANGRVDIDIAGSGDVAIEGGRADPLKIDIAGSGDVRFGGEAVNPDISVMGSGQIYIGSYTGTLTSDGADVTVGKQP